MKTKIFLITCIVLTGYSAFSQVKIGTNPTNINSASLLELESNSQGFVLPRLPIGSVTSSAPLSPSLLTSTIVYNTNSSVTGGTGIGIYIWDGSKWNPISTSISSTAWLLNGNKASGTSYFLGTVDNSSLRFRTNNTQQMIIDSLGNVGIANASPTQKLDVTGNVKFSGALMPNNNAGVAGQFLISSGTGIAPVWFDASGYTWLLDGNPVTSIRKFGTTTNFDLPFITNNTERMRLTAGGFLGIGTTNPSNVLSVSGTNPLYLSGVQATTTFSTDSILTINAGVVKKTAYSSLSGATTNALTLSTNTLTSTVNGVAATSNAVSGVNNTSNANTLSTTVNGVTSATVPIINTNTNALTQAGGLVTSVNGVAATTPISSGTVSNVIGYDASGTPVYQSLNNVNFSTAWNTTGNSGTTAGTNFIGTTDNVDFVTKTNGIERMRVLANGRVGIGITNPAYPLAVKDTMEIRRVGSLSSLLFTNTSGTGDFRIGGDGGDIFWQGGGGRALQMGSYWTTIIGGDRQTGTYPAFINAYTGTSVLVQGQRDVSVPLGVQANSSTQSANLTEWRNSSATALSVINKNGYMGIGITSPPNALSVLAASNPLYLSGVQATTTFNTDSILTINAGIVKKAPFSAINGATTNVLNLSGNVLTSTVNGVAATSNAVSGVSNTSSANILSTTVNGVTGATVPIINANTNALTLSGGLITSVNGVTATTTIANGAINNVLGFTTAGVAVYQPVNNLTLSSVWNLLGNAGTNGSNFLGTTDNISMRFRTNNIQRVIIDSLGNVGVGISNPSNALSVLSASNPLYLSGVQATTTFSTDSILTINAGIVKKTPYSSINSSYWNLTGNSGNKRAVNFLGNADTAALIFKVSNNLAGLIEGTSGNGNTFYGYQSGAATSGANNVAMGSFSLTANTTGFRNTSVGYNSMFTNTSGYENVALGFQSLYSNLSGTQNIALGNLSLFSNTTGSANSTIGFMSLNANTTGYYNTVFGSKALILNTSGNSNTSIGYNNLKNNSTGTGNTVIGANAAGTITTGSNNTLIGTNTDALTATLTNAGAIGYNAKVGLNNSLILGDTTSGGYAVNVGIGVRSPQKRLHIDASPIGTAGAKDSLKIDNLASSFSSSNKAILVIDSTTGYLTSQSFNTLSSGNYWSTTGNSGTSYPTNFLGTTDNNGLHMRTNNVERMLIDSLGSVGIGSANFNTTTGREKLLVDYGTTTSNNLATFRGGINDYLQINIQNTNGGSNASTDYVATANDGTDSTYYVDFGINSSTYAPSVDNFGGPHDGYLYSSSRNLVIGTAATSSDVIFLLGGGRTKYNAALRLQASTGNVVVGTGDGSTTPVGNLIRGVSGTGTNIAGGNLGVQGGAGTGSAAAGNLNLAGGVTGSGTNGVITFSTNSTERMRVDPSGNVGIGTANPGYSLSVLASSNPLYLSGVQATSTFSSDSVLTINAGVVKKTPYASLLSIGIGVGTGNTWSLTGNSITSGQFLGTTNAQALILKANNVQIGSFDGNVSSLALGVGAVNNSSDHNVAIGYNANTNNQYTLAIGYNASATGVRSVAIGNGSSATVASGSEAVAIGYNATANNTQTVAIGYQSQATGQYAVGLGYNSTASGLQSLAVGYQAQATQQYASAFGYQAQATGSASTAIGYLAQTSQSNTILLGNVNQTNLYVGIGTATPTAKLHIVGGNGNNPLQLVGLPAGTVGTDNMLTINSSGVVGSVSAATFASSYWTLSGNAASSGNFLGTTNNIPLQFKFNSTLAGYLDANNTALGTSSAVTAGTQNTSIGYSSTASNSSTAIGASSVAASAGNTAVGNTATANNSSQETAIGATSVANAQYNTAVGYNAQAINNSQATAVGTTALANANQATALGYGAQAISNGQTTALGANSLANAQYNTAVGYNAQAISNSQATAVGYNSKANAQFSVAIGYNAQAINNQQTTAIGSATQATGALSNAIGYNAQATNTQTTADGANTTATAANSSAFGYNAQATGTQSGAIGSSTVASGTQANATGNAAQATGTQTTADGASATATAANASSFGYNAQATNSQTTAIGSGSVANQGNATALGYNAKAQGANSSAIGYNAQTSQSNAMVLGDATNTSLSVGIGTSTPNTSARLDVAGSFKLGSVGTVLSNLIKGTATVNIGAIGIGGTGSTTFSVPNAIVGAIVSVSPKATLPYSVVIGYAYVSAANTVTITFGVGGTATSGFTTTLDVSVLQ